MVSREDVYRALSRVRDPELDKPITELGFIKEVKVHRGRGAVEVSMILPTYWCSPAFAYMMLEDARKVLLKLGGVKRVTVNLLDHHDAERISRCINEGLTFEECYGDEAGEGLSDLRRKMMERSFLARLYRLVSLLTLKGLSYLDILSLKLEDVKIEGERVGIKAGKRMIKLEGEEASTIIDYVEMLVDNGVREGPIIRKSLKGDVVKGIDEFEGLLRRARLTSNTLSFTSQFCMLVLSARRGSQS